MNCEEIKEKIVDYWDGSIKSDDRIEIEKHIAECKNCQKELKALRIVDAAIHKWKGLSPSTNFEAGLSQK